MEVLIKILDFFGTAVFAASGALAAGRKRMDMFGVIVLGCATALGGGTFRDLILADRAVFWVEDNRYLSAAVAATIFTFLLARRRRFPVRTLLHADAVGLSVFTVIGFQAGFQSTGSYGVSVVTGVSTGVVGGILRDILSGEVPLIFRKEVYATASFCGAVLLAVLQRAGAPGFAAIVSGLAATLLLRLAGIHWNLSLPSLSIDRDATGRTGD